MLFRRNGITLLELLVVLAIVGILATIALGVYTNSVQRARISAAFAEVHQIGMAIEQYRLDTGQYPPSSTGTLFSPDLLDQDPLGTGCGYMTLALVHSLNANATAPLDARWNGPYLELDQQQLGTLDGSPIAGKTPPEVQMLDPFNNPYRYVRFDNYGPPKTGVDMNGTKLPATDPFATTEVYYNVSTFQLVSFGPDGVTDTSAPNLIGLGPDDITNFTR